MNEEEIRKKAVYLASMKLLVDKLTMPVLLALEKGLSKQDFLVACELMWETCPLNHVKPSAPS